MSAPASDPPIDCGSNVVTLSVEIFALAPAAPAPELASKRCTPAFRYRLPIPGAPAVSTPPLGRSPDWVAVALDDGGASCLGFTRLSLVGAARQPFVDGELSAVINGELYNHDELRLLVAAPRAADPAERPAALAEQAGKFHEAILLRVAGKLGMFAGEIAVVHRLHLTAVIFFHVAAFENPVAA